MNPEIVNNHLATSRSAVRFLDYSVNQQRCLKRLPLLDDSLPVYFRNYPYPLHAWPWFIAADMRRTLQDCACRVPELIYRALRAEFRDDTTRFAAFFRMQEILASIFLDSGLNLDHVMLRMDAVMTARGLKIMEVNAGPNIGGWQIQWMDQQYRKQPELMPFFEANECRSKNIPLGYMRHLVDQSIAGGALDEGRVNVMFSVDDGFMNDAMQDTFRKLYYQALADAGVQGEIFFEVGIGAVEYHHSGVFLRGRRLSTLVSYHFNTDMVLPHELYRAYLRGLVYWPDNPFVSVLGDKRALAIVYRHRETGLFTPQERAIIEEFVPWCETVRAQSVDFDGRRWDMEQLLLQRRADFVIKIANGAQGNDVFVGRYQSDADWRGIVTRALGEGAWLAQEYCASLPFYGQYGDEGYAEHDVIWGVFGFGRSYGGCWLRLMLRDSGNGIINSAKGAQETIVYEVQD